MSMSFGLATTLSNSQKLTPQMQQAIKLLQLSSLELAQEVQAKLDSNPLLERIEDDEYDSHDDREETDESLTLDSWNQGDGNDSFNNDPFNTVAETNTEYGSDASDSLDKLQQSSIDDSAMDMDNDSSFDIHSIDINTL